MPAAAAIMATFRNVVTGFFLCGRDISNSSRMRKDRSSCKSLALILLVLNSCKNKTSAG